MSRRRTSKQPKKDSDSLETKFKKDKHSQRPCLRNQIHIPIKKRVSKMSK